MTFSADDLREIKWSLLTCLLSIGLCIGLINYSAEVQQQSLQSLKLAQRQLNDARSKFQTAQSDQENMAAYQMEYDALVAQKVIGSEQRLDWIEGLERLRQQNLLPDLKYSIAPQQNYTPTPALNSGNFSLSLSPMSLEMSVLHEVQLLDFLTAMGNQMSGWFLLDSCHLERIGENGPATLKADCDGGWFTMKNRSMP